MSPLHTDAKLYRQAFASLGKTFRGEIWEDAPDVPMGKGYSNDGKPFDITTAHYLKPPFRAIRRHDKLKVVFKKGVQALGTFTAEKSAAYFIVHDPGDMCMYDCQQEAARDHAKSRLGPLLKSIPGIAEQIQEVEDRHDVSTKEYYLPGMTLRVWPLNESCTQRITLRYVIIHDAFLSKRTGLIKQAIARTTQHPHDKKIIIESQGGEEGDDFDKEYETTDMGALHVLCPLCGTGQPFEFSRERPSDFTPCPPLIIPSLDHVAWIEHNRPKMVGAFSGFQRGPDDQVLLADGTYNAEAIKRLTYYECYHCGGKWHDTPETRLALDASSYYVPLNPGADPDNAGFNWPNWINQRVKWGGEEVMLGYLNAKKAEREYGQIEDLKQWYQKRAGITWSEKLIQKRARVITSSHDVSGTVPDEVARMFLVDCQQDPDISAVAGKPVIGHFWYIAWAVDKNAKNIYQLARGYAKSWKEWINLRKALKIPNKNVAVDGGHWLHELIEYAAVNWEVGTNHDMRGKAFKARTTWTILRGNGKRNSWKHADGISRVFSPPTPYAHRVQIGNEMITIQVPVVEWSSLAVKDQLRTIRLGGEGKPKYHILPREKLDEQTQQEERDACTYERQINNEYRTTKNGKPFYAESNPNVHYNDDDCMGIVQCARGGLIGHIAAPDEGQQEA